MVTIGVKSVYFEALLSGKKTHEGRKANGRFASLKNGDRVFLFNEETNQVVERMIVDKQVFPTLEDGVRVIGWRNLMPHESSEEAVITAYRQWVSGPFQVFALVPTS